MSLKAKIEAVIYAAEEPVTLLQLAGLLGHEAQAELDHRASAQRSLALEPSTGTVDDDFTDSADPDTLNEEILSVEGITPEDPEPESAVDVPDEQTGPDPLTPGPTAATPGDGEAAEISIDARTPEETSAQGSAPSKDDKQLARDARARDARLREFFRELLDELVRDYATSDRGLEIREVAGGYRLATKPEYHDAVRGFVKSLKPPLKLSLQALETLAVVAYKQPVTAPEVSEIRGVDSGGVLGSLMARKLVSTAGRKPVIGRPILYKTTKDFLLRFGLKDINELPSIEEFEKMAGELADQDPIQEEISMQDDTSKGSLAGTDIRNPDLSASDLTAADLTAADLQEERDAIEPQGDGDSTDLDNATADDFAVDGRLSGLPPTYDAELDANPDADSPAKDAEVQGQLKSDR